MSKIPGKASSYFFFFGFITSKLRFIPITILSSTLTIISYVFYLIAYSLWLAATFFHLDHKERQEEWYGFAQFKEQIRFSALIGFIACTISIASVFFPVLIIPAVWLFFGSNVFWVIGEYHKLKSPPEGDIHYNPIKQDAYVSYTAIGAGMGLITAIGATLSILCPPIAIPTLILSSVICVGLGVLAIRYWLTYTFGENKPTPVGNSYQQIEQSLGGTSDLEHSDDMAPHPETELFKTTELQPLKHAVSDSQKPSQSVIIPSI